MEFTNPFIVGAILGECLARSRCVAPYSEEAAVGVELDQERIGAEQRRHEERAAVAVLNVGGGDDGVHQEALRIDQNVSLLALDFLACIVARRVMDPPFSALFTLWLSITAAVGEASREAASRHITYSA